jgi:predicted ATPase
MDVGVEEPPPAAEPRGRPLLGRSAEQAVIGKLLKQPDRGGALLIRGPAGIGKSALVNDAIRRAGQSRRVLRATGTPSESGLEFAALYQLLRPVMAGAGSIPAARRTALNVAFGGGA